MDMNLHDVESVRITTTRHNLCGGGGKTLYVHTVTIHDRDGTHHVKLYSYNKQATVKRDRKIHRY